MGAGGRLNRDGHSYILSVFAMYNLATGPQGKRHTDTPRFRVVLKDIAGRRLICAVDVEVDRSGLIVTPEGMRPSVPVVF